MSSYMKPQSLRGRSDSVQNVTENREAYELLFQRMASRSRIDGSKVITKETFVKCLETELRISLSHTEILRLWDSIIPTNKESGEINETAFLEALERTRFLRRVADLYLPSDSDDSFAVPAGYDYTQSTYENYKMKGSTGEEEKRLKHFGEFADFRAAMDYEYHDCVNENRQRWQDSVIHSIAETTESVEHPWIVYTCGPMGAGKGYALSWMSDQGYFPLEKIVHIDADHFKTCMPEWKGYVQNDPKTAGSLCHKESGFLQELAQEVAMGQSQNVWIDGSLRDGKWFAKVFDEIRQNHPAYRIAIFVVEVSEDLAWERCQSRAARTGRTIPKELFLDSFHQPDSVLRMLTHRVDFIARIDNEHSIPRLKAFETVDISGDWNLISRFFRSSDAQKLRSWSAATEIQRSVPFSPAMVTGVIGRKTSSIEKGTAEDGD